MKTNFNKMRVTIHLDKTGNLCGIKGKQVSSRFHCKADENCCEKIYGAMIVPLEQFQQLRDAIKNSVDEGSLHHLPQCRNTGMDEEPTECSPNCLIGLTLEDNHD